MRKYLLWLPLSLALLYLATACDPCRKLAKSPKIADKDSAAYCYYERGQYEAAAIHFEELMGFYNVSPRGETIMYMFAQSKMRSGQLITAAYYFQQFVERYPNSDLVQEATYFIGYSYYLQSNDYELDQGETRKAIEYFSLYLQVYPGAERRAKVEEMIAELRDRLAHKAYNHAQLYLDMERYKAARVAFQVMLQEYPDSEYREKAQFGLFKSAARLAENSVQDKQYERYESAEDYYLRFVDKFPDSKFSREAEKLYEDVQAALVRLKANNETVE